MIKIKDLFPTCDEHEAFVILLSMLWDFFHHRSSEQMNWSVGPCQDYTQVYKKWVLHSYRPLITHKWKNSLARDTLVYVSRTAPVAKIS